jgi:hypothetical protein
LNDDDPRPSRSWPQRQAKAIAAQFRDLIAAVPDDVLILDLYARHIWRETHDTL